MTGAVASNLIGRLTAALVAGLVGAETSFLFFAALNIAGAALAPFHSTAMRPSRGSRGHFWAPGSSIFRARLRRTFAIGFLILFGFIGVFTYVGFVLMRPPYSLSMTALGFVFLVFLPSMVTTPLAGSIARSHWSGPLGSDLGARARRPRLAALPSLSR